MSSYKELLAKRAEVERQLAEMREAEIAKAVASIRELIDEFQLSPLDLGYSRKELLAAASTRGKKAQGAGTGGLPPKYRNPETGQTWSGRGRMPNWLTPETADEFAI